jgi:glycogen(starch) synthase
MSRRRSDVLYCEGPGDIVSAYKSWKEGINHLSETSVTFSGQVFEFCRSENLSLYAVSSFARADKLVDKQWTVTNVPRWPINIPKIGYDLSVTIHSVRLLLRAFHIRPKVILMSTGVTGFAILSLFRLTGANIIVIAHNTLWPEGFPPSGMVAIAQRQAQRFLWRQCIASTIVVSPAAQRQIQTVSGVPLESIHVMRPTFPAAGFADVPAPKQFSSRPFRIMFAGRIEENKGVFDLLSIAEGLKAASNRAFQFSVCGDGSAVGVLRQQIEARGLQEVVKIYGRLNRPELVAKYLDSHLVVVPTRSSFAEGFAMVVAEAILLLRPVLTSNVVPASEVFSSAVAFANTDDVQSYILAIKALSNDERRYIELVEECRRLRPFILNNSNSFLAALHTIRSSNAWAEDHGAAPPGMA